MTQSTPTPDLLPTVAANVLRVLDTDHPVYIDNALSDYAWAHVEVEQGFSKEHARFAVTHGLLNERRHRACEAIAIAAAHALRLRAMDRDDLRAELERVAGVMAEAA